MSETEVVQIISSALIVILKVSAPMLIFGLTVGVIISVFQAVTSIQEQTLAFVPKIVAIFVSLILFGPWILTTLMEFITNLYKSINTFIS